MNEKPLKSKMISIIMALILLLAGFISYAYYQHLQVVKHEKAVALAKKKQMAKLALYLSSLRKANKLMLTSGAKIELMVNQYTQVWHDAIYNNGMITINGKVIAVNDFNEAIQKQYDYFQKDGDFQYLDNDKNNIDQLMNTLKNPPAKFKDTYDNLLNMYSDYTEYLSMVEEPSGSYNSYTSKANNLSDDMAKAYNKIKIMLPTYSQS